MMDDMQLLVQAIVANAKQLGLTWTLRPATLHAIDVSGASATITLDGDTATIEAINLIGNINVGARVMCVIVPNEAVYIVGPLGNALGTGELVLRIRQDAGGQTIPTAGAGTFINFDTEDYDPFDWWSTSDADAVTPLIPGWYNCVARIVWAANATSRRACGINMNGTTSGADTLSLQSLQTPATGTCQIIANGVGLFNGTTDFVGVRGIQNSGGDLLTSNSDGGSVLEMYYAGPGRI